MPRPPSLILVTPYLADANNGNWRTAARWARQLAPSFDVILQGADDPVTGGARDRAVAMVALHARRSHRAIAAWRDAHADRVLVVALTGTDLYRDLPAGDADAVDSIARADALIVLQDDALRHLPARDRRKAHVVFQSARALAPVTKARKRLDCVLVAHLRAEKDPATVFAAWRRLPVSAPATLTIIGAPLDTELGDQARALAAHDPRVHYVGPRAHTWTRAAIKRAHVLVVPSRMEGGANVVVEALTSGTAVLGSRMSGNLGMLGRDYRGYFRVGDAAGLARLIERASRDRACLRSLTAQCAKRAPLFSPAAERAALFAAIRAACQSSARAVPHRGQDRS